MDAVSQGTKDRFEIASKTIAIMGGIISAVALILTLRGTSTQRARELRWDQARLAMSFTDAMLDDARAFEALRMIDWDRRTYAVAEGKQAAISSTDVHHALDVRSNDSLSDTDVYVRETFDHLFYHFGKIERAVKTRLIEVEDVTSPIDYYTPILLDRYGDVLIAYMRQLGDCDALNLLHRFEPRRAPACLPPTPKPAS
jgi:hypothetical protein